MSNAALIERHHATLQRLLAVMLVYIGLADDTGQAMRFIMGAADAYDRNSGIGGAAAAERAFAKLGEPWTISRRVHAMIRQLLYPVEAATRRLIIVMAADLPTPKLRPSERARKPPLWAWQKQKRGSATTARIITLPRTWSAGVMVPLFAAPNQPMLQPDPHPAFIPPRRYPRFSLLDPLKRARRRRYVRHPVPPRIADAGGYLRPIPPRLPATPYDALPEHRLLRRVCALAAALHDLPKQARRFARWRAFCNAGLTLRQSTLRPGTPPGSPPLRMPEYRQREEHTVLAATHSLAWYVLNYPDTS